MAVILTSYFLFFLIEIGFTVYLKITKQREIEKNSDMIFIFTHIFYRINVHIIDRRNMAIFEKCRINESLYCIWIKHFEILTFRRNFLIVIPMPDWWFQASLCAMVRICSDIQQFLCIVNSHYNWAIFQSTH